MTMVKRALLASAAGLVATAGAQAADLPVKAKAAEYVKVCSLYGVGFYYIPGTDTCIRIGGHLRSEFSFYSGGSGTQNWGSNQAFQDRATDYYYTRQRVYMQTDVRSQTEYGTLRAYSVIKWEFATPGGNGSSTQTLGVDVGFIQWGGFLVGRAPTSYFDMPWNYASYYNSSVNLGTSDSTGGRFVAAYTQQFGNGVSGTISLEESKPYTSLGGDRPIFNAGAALSSTAATIAANNAALFGSASAATAAALGAPGSALTNSGGGQRAPDIVGQLRVEQAWGTFQLAGAAHLNRALYYGAVETSGNPSDKWGGAVSAGIKLNVPSGTGDFVALGGAYSVGATAYAYGSGGSLATNPALFAFASAPAGSYQSLGFSYVYDAVYGAGTNLELTTAWGGNIAYWHNWNAQWASSLNAGYVKFDYNGTASALLCSAQMGGTGASTLAGRISANAAGTIAGTCNPDYAIWTIGSRTVWTPVKDFVIGAEVLYSQHHSANNGQFYTGSTGDALKPAAVYGLKDQGVVSGFFSVRRYF